MKVTMLMFWFYVMLINVTNFAKSVDLQKWEDFKIKFAKHYATPKEEKMRKEIFEKNLRMITKHNIQFRKGKESYEMGMNSFGDMTKEEFARMNGDRSFRNNLRETLTSRQGPSIITSLPPGSGPAPEFKNWTNEGAVTPVQQQGNCASCWTFAVAGVIESHNFIHTGKLVALSKQQLLDCVGEHINEPHNYTCEGGRQDIALQYVIENQGIATEESYPYEGKQGSCRYNDENKGATIVNYNELRSGDEILMKNVVGLVGPVTASIYSGERLKFHRNGIYENPECLNATSLINHAVLVVGYGIEEDEAYWLVKNSWGSKWGENGYFKMRRGTNECEISEFNLYPVL